MPILRRSCTNRSRAFIGSKPFANRVYWLATERLRVSNPELGFVSANNWDGVATVSAGLRTFWIQRSTAEVPEELGFQVDTTVKAITDLPALLRG